MRKFYITQKYLLYEIYLLSILEYLPIHDLVKEEMLLVGDLFAVRSFCFHIHDFSLLISLFLINEH